MLHTVHVYREMKLVYRNVEAADQRAAAVAAMQMPTDSANVTEDCDGATFAALVDVNGDAEFEQSKVFSAPANIATPIFGEGICALHDVAPLGVITHIEVNACVEDDGGSVSQVGSDEAAQFWSVYVRYQPGGERGEVGGVDCIADFATEQDARLHAQHIASLLRVPVN